MKTLFAKTLTPKDLFWILVAVNIIDFVLTTVILINGGSEANPFVNVFVERFGNIGVLIPKIFPLCLFGILVYFLWEKIHPIWRKGTEYSIILINLCYVSVITYSLGLIYFYLL